MVMLPAFDPLHDVAGARSASTLRALNTARAPLTIVHVAFPLAPVRADAVGGAEHVLLALDRALVAAGHRSIVIACAGSQVEGQLVALPPVTDSISTASWFAAHAACRAAIRDTLAREHVDVVHMHGIDFHAYLPEPGPVVLATLHLPLDWYPADALRTTRPATFLHGVSRSQVRAPPPGVQLLEPIENGVDLEVMRPHGERGDHALVLGRICPEKGQHLALDAATRAGVPLVVVGAVFGHPEHQRYFREQVTPRLGPPHRFLGTAAGAAKARLIAGARCLVVPSVVDETSSLVAMEALACGTPVVAFERGALVELIDDGATGRLVRDVDELADAVREAGRLDRARCRAVAEARCSHERMCARYLARYRELVAAPARAPAVRRLRVELLDGDELERLAPSWDELWARCNDATVFQRPAWCLPWCRHLLAGEVQTIAVWSGDTLEGLVPMFRWRSGEGETLSLIGAGASDYQDLLVAPGATGVIRAIAAALPALRWDRVEWSELRDGSPLLALPVDGSRTREPQEPCPVLPLAGQGLDAVAPAVRRDIEYQRRRAAREIGIEHVAIPAADVAGELARLHHARWSMRGQSGVLGEPKRALLSAAIERLDAAGAVIAAGVVLGGELAAIAVGFLDRDRVRYYLGGFAPGHRHRSPGTLAIAAAIEEAARRGARWFDFLRGAEPYKYRFGARDHVRLHRLVIQR